MTKYLRLSLLIACFVAGPIQANDGDPRSHRCRPVGTWLITVEFSQVKFLELLTLNADRTLHETNNSLHPNTPPFAKPPFAPPMTGSDGVGVWKRMRGCKIQFSFLKLVFAAEDLLPPVVKNFTPKGLPIGFFRVSGEAEIVGNMFVSEKGKVTSELILGPHPMSPDGPPITFGESVSMGYRLLATD